MLLQLKYEFKIEKKNMDKKMFKMPIVNNYNLKIKIIEI